MTTRVLVGAIRLVICLTGVSAFANLIIMDPPLDMGTVLPNYAIVSVGPTASLMVNSGPITGKVLIGDSSTATSAGGGNGQVTGGLDISPIASGDQLQNLQTPPTVNVVSPTVGTTAFSDAGTLSSSAAALMATQTFGSISGTQTITGGGGLNVIDVGSLQNPTLTLSGGPDDLFVFDVSGNFNTNRPMILNGVNASQILWNFLGTGTVFQTSGGNTLFGTFLATNGGNFQFSALNLTGELINTGGHIQFVSNSKMTGDPFAPPAAVPEPATATLLLLGTGFVMAINLRYNLLALLREFGQVGAALLGRRKSMKMIRSVFTLIAVPVVCASIASATIIGDLETGSVGTVTVTLTSLTFNPDTSSTPPGPPWNADVATGTNVTFAGCPSGVLGTAGCLDPNEAILVTSPLTSTTTLPIANFLTFASNGVTHATLVYSLTGLGPGSSNTHCQGLGIGDSCSVFAGAPLILTRTASGTEANLSVMGFASDGTGSPTQYVGEFESPIAGMTPGDLQLFFCPSGTCQPADFTSGKSVTRSQSGDFTEGVVSEPQTTAEPQTAALLLGGLLVLLGRAGMRLMRPER